MTAEAGKIAQNNIPVPLIGKGVLKAIVKKGVDPFLVDEITIAVQRLCAFPGHRMVVIKEVRALSTQTICVVMVKDNGVHGAVFRKRVQCFTSAAVMVQHV